MDRCHRIAALLLAACGALPLASAADPATEAYGAGNYARAAELLKPRAEAGNERAQVLLGRMYLQGLGVDKNEARAMKLFHKAALYGGKLGEFELGRCYAEGTAIPQDFVEAARWYTRSAHQQVPEAEFNLGQLYRRGVGVAPDAVLALAWLSAAAEDLEREASADRRAQFESARDEAAGAMTEEQVAASRALAVPAGPARTAEIQNREEVKRWVRGSYPESLRRSGGEGDVVILLHVATDGRVTESQIETSSSEPLLDRATQRLAEHIVVAPKVLDGRPVESWQHLKWSWRLF
jgi:TonB family protein